MLFTQTAPLIGITFSVIILRVSLGISSRQLTTQASQPSNGHTAVNSGDNYALGRRAVAVNVNVQVDTDEFSRSDPDELESSAKRILM